LFASSKLEFRIVKKKITILYFTGGGGGGNTANVTGYQAFSSTEHVIHDPYLRVN